MGIPAMCWISSKVSAKDGRPLACMYSHRALYLLIFVCLSYSKEGEALPRPLM